MLIGAGLYRLTRVLAYMPDQRGHRISDGGRGAYRSTPRGILGKSAFLLYYRIMAAAVAIRYVGPAQGAYRSTPRAEFRPVGLIRAGTTG